MTEGDTTLRKRVLLIGSYAPSLVNFRGPLVAAMRSAGHCVTACAPDIDEVTASQLRKLGAEPRALPIKNSSLNPMSLIKSVCEVYSLIVAVKPDVIISYTIKPVILAGICGRAARVGRIVSLITGVGYAFTDGPELKRLVSRIAASVLYRLAFGRSDIILFQNPDDLALFQRLRLLPRRVATAVVDGSGVQIENFVPAPIPIQARFLMIARLLKDKGIREFIAAATWLKQCRPEVSISLVGYRDGSPDSIDDNEVEQIARSGIEFLGRQDDVRQAIANCSVYVLPSYREGTPRSVLEAMAMGRAIITTDAPGCRETVQDGINGFLVPVRDAEALFVAMLRFVDAPELARTMGRESRRIAERRYDARRVSRVIMRHADL